MEMAFHMWERGRELQNDSLTEDSWKSNNKQNVSSERSD
jgi:hypothetical protein